jgi:hypothetical protein
VLNVLVIYPRGKYCNKALVISQIALRKHTIILTFIVWECRLNFDYTLVRRGDNIYRLSRIMGYLPAGSSSKPADELRFAGHRQALVIPGDISETTVRTAIATTTLPEITGFRLTRFSEQIGHRQSGFPADRAAHCHSCPRAKAGYDSSTATRSPAYPGTFWRRHAVPYQSEPLQLSGQARRKPEGHQRYRLIRLPETPMSPL